MARDDTAEEGSLTRWQRLKAWLVKRLSDHSTQRSVLSHLHIPVDQVMKSRDQIAAIKISTPQKELYKIIRKTKYSRLLLYEKDLDHPVGMLHVKDLLNWLLRNAGTGEGEKPFPIRTFCRDVLFTPSSRPCYDLLREMQKKRTHLAVIVDEHGGTDGLVSIEDLLEKVVGAIDDEHDQPATPSIIKRSALLWEVSARVPVEELAKITNVSLSNGNMDVKTVGGLITKMMGRVPKKGESIRHSSGLIFKVLEVQKRRIIWVHIAKTPGMDALSTTDSPRPHKRS